MVNGRMQRLKGKIVEHSIFVYSLFQLFVCNVSTLSSNQPKPNCVHQNVLGFGQIPSTTRRNILNGILSVASVVASVDKNSACYAEDKIPVTFDIDSYFWNGGKSLPETGMPTNEYGIANPDEIKKAFLNHETIILDVRNPDEIITDGRLSQFENTNTYVFSPCTLTECKSLSEAPEKVLQMDNKNITIVVYCASGRRAAAAKRILQEKGYTGNIINAGGYKDIKAMLEV